MSAFYFQWKSQPSRFAFAAYSVDGVEAITALIVLIAIEATKERSLQRSLFVNGKLTVEIQIEDPAGSAKRKSRRSDPRG